jgi:hypothetical protein
MLEKLTTHGIQDVSMLFSLADKCARAVEGHAWHSPATQPAKGESTTPSVGAQALGSGNSNGGNNKKKKDGGNKLLAGAPTAAFFVAASSVALFAAASLLAMTASSRTDGPAPESCYSRFCRASSSPDNTLSSSRMTRVCLPLLRAVALEPPAVPPRPPIEVPLRLPVGPSPARTPPWP